MSIWNGIDKMTLLKCISILALVGLAVSATVRPCVDIDSSACTKMEALQPDLCSNPTLSATACPAYCNLCQATATAESAPTTTMASTPLPVVTSTCDDIDTSACHLMAMSRPDLCMDDVLANSACKWFCNLCPMTCYHCNASVTDFHQCQTTKQCQTGEVCMTKKLHSSFDNHEEYTMTCEPKQRCDGGDVSVVIGKRGINARDLSISCCFYDRCNYPEVPTTLVQTVPTTSQPSCKKDIIFMIEGSALLHGYQHDVKTFISDIVQDLDIGQDASLVSMATYSTHVNKLWDLDGRPHKNGLLDAIHKDINIPSSRPDFQDALMFITNYATTQRAGDRKNADDVVVFLWGKEPDTSHQTASLANQLHHISSDVISISVGSHNSHNVISTDSKHELHVQNGHGLDSIKQTVLQLICK